MASFIFEQGTQAQAAAFTSTDTLIFNTATPTQLGVAYAAAQGLTASSVTLSFGTQSLTFSADALKAAADATHISFLTGNGTLSLGSATATSTGNVTIEGASAYYGLGSQIDNGSVAGGGNDLINTGAGDDSIFATAAQLTTVGTGNYILEGGLGNDIINATNAEGNLHIYGGDIALAATANAADGSDTITLNHSFTTVNSGGATVTVSATDYVNGMGGNDIISVSATAGGTKNDLYRLNGGAGDDTIVGGTGTNSINGNTGNDSIIGNGSNDFLHGGQGNDVIAASTVVGSGTQLFGDLGNDTLVAGGGSGSIGGINVLTGGAGNDVFSFTSVSATSYHLTSADTTALKGYVTEVTDFTQGQDKIHLNLSGASTAATSVNVIVGAATFTSASAALTYAQGLLNQSTATGTTHDVAAIQVNGDTYLFSQEGVTNAHTNVTVDTAIKLDSITASALKATDFI